MKFQGEIGVGTESGSITSAVIDSLRIVLDISISGSEGDYKVFMELNSDDGVVFTGLVRYLDLPDAPNDIRCVRHIFDQRTILTGVWAYHTDPYHFYAILEQQSRSPVKPNSYDSRRFST